MHVLSILLLTLFPFATATAAPRQQSALLSAQATPPIPAPDASGVYKVGHGVLPPRLLASVDPEYSEEARRARINAECSVALTVDVKGHPKDIHIVRSAAEGQPQDMQEAAATLDPKAVEAIKKYKFAPASLNGNPVPVSLTIEVSFRTFLRN